MLRRAQHERKLINEFKANAVRPEPGRRVNGGFSAPLLVAILRIPLFFALEPELRNFEPAEPTTRLILGNTSFTLRENLTPGRGG